MGDRGIAGRVQARPILESVAIVGTFVIASMILRGQPIEQWDILNRDEAELMAEARVAVHSPVPFSTWITGTNGPYSVLFLVGLLALGAPATPVFAHLLAAVLLGLTASAIFFSASRAIGRKAAVVFVLVWWFPIAVIYPLGSPVDYGAMSTEYLPVLLIAVSALVSLEQLAARPWVFGVVGMLAGLAIGSKYQLGPVALAFVGAQLIVLRPTFRRTVVMGFWWLAGALLPALVLLLAMLRSSATNWALVDQMSMFLGDYVGRSPLDKLGSTALALAQPGLYILVLLGFLIWLGRRSDKASNVARAILVASGLVAMLVPGMGFPHYNLVLFGSIALAATMPVRSDGRSVLQQVSPAALSGAMALTAAAFLGFGLVIGCWAPLLPGAAAAALSSDSVHRNPTFTRACPPGSPALVWGWAAEIYLVQDWRSTVPYQDVVPFVQPPANKIFSEPLVRTGVDRAMCIVDVTRIESRSPTLPVPGMVLTQFYPRLEPVLSTQFHVVPIPDGCAGCILYVRNAAP